MREILVVTPVYNDWQSLEILVESLEQVAARFELHIRILAVDDGSTLPPPTDLPASLKLIRLARNLGHQRAIAVGLSIAQAMRTNLPVVVMDCDGEDRPEDIPLLLAEFDAHPGQIIFAQRAKRSEGGLFRIFYAFFKWLFLLLTGHKINFGNFCPPPACAESSICRKSGTILPPGSCVPACPGAPLPPRAAIAMPGVRT
jgi:glycosyltransferase involved in cell wall biosynthesis